MLSTLKYPTPKRLRIIDGLIAEHLFGWKWFSKQGKAYLLPPHYHQEARAHKVLWAEGLTEHVSYDDSERKCEKSYEIENHFPSNYSHLALPKYTTDRADNWRVIEELTKQCVILSLMYKRPYKPPWQVQTAAANDLMVAVCLCALDNLNIELPWKSKPKRGEGAASRKECAVSR